MLTTKPEARELGVVLDLGDHWYRRAVWPGVEINRQGPSFHNWGWLEFMVWDLPHHAYGHSFEEDGFLKYFLDSKRVE